MPSPNAKQMFQFLVYTISKLVYSHSITFSIHTFRNTTEFVETLFLVSQRLPKVTFSPLTQPCIRNHVFFFFIKTCNCTLLTLHTSLTVVTILTKLTLPTMLPLLQFILLTYNIYFSEVDNTTHHRHSADTSIRF